MSIGPAIVILSLNQKAIINSIVLGPAVAILRNPHANNLNDLSCYIESHTIYKNSHNIHTSGNYTI